MEKIIDEKVNLGLVILKDLISCKSVLDEYKENTEAPFGKENKKALDYILTLGEKLGFKSGNVDNYAGYLEFGEGKELLGVLAHLDVVPVVESEWNTDPFTLTINGDKMYGRGTTDDKGPLVASLMAMLMLKEEGFKPNKRIRLIMGCDEESGSRCLERYLEKEGEPDMAFSPDAEFPVIYGEKAIISYDVEGKIDDPVIKRFKAGTRYNIVPSYAQAELKLDLKDAYLKYLKDNNYKGEVDGDIYTAYGVASHAMAPEKGLNAIFILFDFLNKYTNSNIAKIMDRYFLFDLKGEKLGYNDTDKEMGILTSNLAVVNYDNNKLFIGVNCRCPHDDSFEVIPAKLDVLKDYNLKMTDIRGSKRHYVPKDSKLVSTLMKVYKDVTGRCDEPITIGGGTYAREIVNAVAYGPLMPGAPDVCHIANEYMNISDFKNAIKIYYYAIKELCK